MMSMSSKGALNAFALLALCATGSAQAQSAAAATPADSGWRYEGTPYLWAAGVSGTTRVGTRLPAVHVDASFSDLVDQLDVGLMGTFEARKGRWGVVFDGLYMKLSADVEPLVPERSGTNTAELKETLLQIAGAYRVFDDAVTAVDVLAGARYTNLEVELNLVPTALRPLGRERSGNVDWTDGFVGGRVLHKLSDRWSLVGYADLGGGGTDKSWQLIAGANYRFSDKMSGKFGYRILSMDYDKTEFLYNIKTAGIYAGLGFRF